MTIQTTRYSPDTCECVIEYSWDDTLSESNRVHTLSNYVRKCAAHSILATDNDRWNCIFEENPKKAGSLQEVLALAPAGMFDTVNNVRQLKETIRFNVSFSGSAPNRVLTISFPNFTLTTNQKNIIQSALNSRFGVGKVLIA